MRRFIWAGVLVYLGMTAGAMRARAAGNGAAATPAAHTVIVERIIARVNDQIITSLDLEQAQAQLMQELQQAHDNQTVDVERQEKNLLRDLIDQKLLLQRANDLGLSAETDTVRRLDQIRQRMHLATMRDLRRAIRAQGVSYSQFKQSIKNQILTQKVIENDVAPRIQMTPEDIKAYYQAHLKEFVRPDEVELAEILIATKGKPASMKPRLKKLAEEIQVRVANGADFSKMAVRYSKGSTAAQGGNLGYFQKSMLAPVIQRAVFHLSPGQVTPVLTMSDGYLIFKVVAEHHAGQESLSEATPHIQNVLYEQKLGPELRRFLTRLRHEAYIRLSPGYEDTGARPNAGINLTRFERVLPQDMPKPVEKPKSSGGFGVH